LPPSTIVSSDWSFAARSFTEASTTAAGTISQTERGGFSFATKSSSEAAPAAPSAASPRTVSALRSHTTHSWPARMRRRTMFAPMRPRPIIPSCIGASEENVG
jgi:hypothetical protein